MKKEMEKSIKGEKFYAVYEGNENYCRYVFTIELDARNKLKKYNKQNLRIVELFLTEINFDQNVLNTVCDNCGKRAKFQTGLINSRTGNWCSDECVEDFYSNNKK